MVFMDNSGILAEVTVKTCFKKTKMPFKLHFLICLNA